VSHRRRDYNTAHTRTARHSGNLFACCYNFSASLCRPTIAGFCYDEGWLHGHIYVVGGSYYRTTPVQSTARNRAVRPVLVDIPSPLGHDRQSQWLLSNSQAVNNHGCTQPSRFDIQHAETVKWTHGVLYTLHVGFDTLPQLSYNTPWLLLPPNSSQGVLNVVLQWLREVRHVKTVEA